ncbi:lytic transglycosylase domain-containing protein [Burkholderia sp. MBR-1]|uniref:lytic transglycosylase domain-containing protein n=1 Tax=Burkholderia sp. MBR-1 TaxID=2732364 RepID=UPI0015EF0416|nr:lytic transglycosylase domain-containing protein [Burkholderia sp. MBR-1]QMI49763.1 lytic transglycosylase domain-containing protein [Burkholderia sp. MBR-1]
MNAFKVACVFGFLGAAAGACAQIPPAVTVEGGALAQCIEHVARKYGRDPGLYYAIAQVESSGCKNLTHRNTNGTDDIGCMQINSSLLPFLAQYGITREALRNDWCLNVHVGGWVLEEKIRRFGPTWEAVGAYNTACSKLKGQACVDSRMKYISKVSAAYRQWLGRSTATHVVPTQNAGGANTLRVSEGAVQ